MANLDSTWRAAFVFARLFGLVLILLFSCRNGAARETTPTIKLDVRGPSDIRVQIELSEPTDSWSFRNAVAGALGLGERIKEFTARNVDEGVEVRKIAAGEFRSETPANEVRYRADLSPGRPGDWAHVSWLTRDVGLLMLADLVPESLSTKNSSILVQVPNGWMVQSSVNYDNEGRFLVAEPQTAVFVVGHELHTSSRSVKGVELKLARAGKWHFNDKSVLQSASKVLEWYVELTRFKLRNNATILLVPFPQAGSSSQWKAETRGSTVVLLLNPEAETKNWIGQLGIIFTHELFHLWVPNSLSLTGDYDWFFEGFTLYVALQAALNLKLIRFHEYLDTLARVYDSYLSYTDNQTLIEASEKRWTSAVPLVYDKGMLAAFIYDLTVRQESNASSSLIDCYRLLFEPRTDKPADANAVIISLLTSSPATAGFSASYIESRSGIKLEKVLPSFGLQINTEGSRSRLSVLKQLTTNQQVVLSSLGFRK